MSIIIGHRPVPVESRSPAAMLVECHDRIRQAMRGARGLATAAANDAAVAPTAAAVHRYFSIALPLHSQDEDLSLAPRLFAAGVPDGLDYAVRTMTAQHATIDLLLDRLLPLWDRLQRSPADLDRVREALAADTAALDELWNLHLPMEEQIIFPHASATLTGAAQQEIVDEMRARRQANNSIALDRRRH